MHNPEPTRSEPSPLLTPLWILAAFACAFVAQEVSTIAIWILLSFFFFAFLDPWMQRLSRKGISPVLSAVGLVSLVTLICSAAIAMIIHFSGHLTADLGIYRKTVIHVYDSVSGSINQQLLDLTHSPDAKKIVADSSISQVEVVDKSPLGGTVGESLVHGIGTAFTGIIFGLLVPILAFFMISERKSLGTVFGKYYNDFPGEDKRGALIWSRITEATGAYFLGNLVLGAISFPVFCVAFFYFGIKAPYALAALASLFNLVPFVGALLSGVLPVLDLLSVPHPTLGPVIGLMLTCALIHFTFANLVTPKILGSKLDLNATTSTIALVTLGEWLGAPGLLLAIPIAATFKILFQHSRSARLQWIAMLMCDDPESILNQGNRLRAMTRFKKPPPVSRGE